MKKNLLLSIFCAVLLVLSFPNFNFPFLIWFALVPFFILLDGKSLGAAFFWGWLTGYLFFLGTHYWLIHVTLPGMLLVNLYLGIYFGLFGVGYAIFTARARSTVPLRRYNDLCHQIGCQQRPNISPPTPYPDLSAMRRVV